MKFEFDLKNFPTHIEKTDNKVAVNKFVKINNQSIYNGAINRFTRNTVIKNMHKYIENELIKHDFKSISFKSAVSISFKIKTVLNHGNISRRSGKINWKKPSKKYVPNWDIENLASIWIKCINDVLVKNGVILDDNVYFLSKISYEFEEVQDINDLEIKIKIIDNEEENTIRITS